MGGLYAMPSYSGNWNTAVSAGNSAGDGWRLASMEDYRKLVGWGGKSGYDDWNNITVRTLGTSSSYINAVFVLGEDAGRHFSSETDLSQPDHARTMDIFSSTTGRYGYPQKGSTLRYVLVHD